MKIELLKKSPSKIETYLLTAENGFAAEIINYGARIHRLFVPDKNGARVDILAGFATADGYRRDNPYFNAIIGRVANRIGGAAFELNGRRYSLFANDDMNTLHGGEEGFDKKYWSAKINKAEKPSLEMTYFSADGEEGFPGNLTVKVTYSLGTDNSLKIAYDAVCDTDTHVNLTNHAYFNLGGDFSVPVLDHEVSIKSHKMTAVDDELIPTGEIVDITDSVYDFNLPKTIGRNINADDKYLKIAGGYDFNYILDNPNDGSSVASAYCPQSGIQMDVVTDCPCIQFYTGNFLNGIGGKVTYHRNTAFCLETGGYPNACNIPSFPSTVLKRGDAFHSETTYVFKTK